MEADFGSLEEPLPAFGGIWEAFGGIWEASGGIWEASGGIWEAWELPWGTQDPDHMPSGW